MSRNIGGYQPNSNARAMRALFSEKSQDATVNLPVCFGPKKVKGKKLLDDKESTLIENEWWTVDHPTPNLKTKKTKKFYFHFNFTNNETTSREGKSNGA